MRYIGTAATDVGMTKETNQDSLCVKVADTREKGQVAMAVICDGMGGLDKGELASAAAIRECEKWFSCMLPGRLGNYSWKGLAEEWTCLVSRLNDRILDYGKQNHISLGTTLTAMLMIEGEYMIVHVGDTRVYELSRELKLLTKDQTFVAREVEAGNMTPQQAATDSRRNLLLQCVGASATVVPEILFGRIYPETIFLLCSDGFRHVVAQEEIYHEFQPSQLQDAAMMAQRSRQMIDVVKARKECDNISVALIKCVE